MLVIPATDITVKNKGRIPVNGSKVDGLQVIAKLPDGTGKKLIPTTKYIAPVATRPYGSDAHTHIDKQGIGYNVPGYPVAVPRPKVEKKLEVEIAETVEDESAPAG